MLSIHQINARFCLVLQALMHIFDVGSLSKLIEGFDFEIYLLEVGYMRVLVVSSSNYISEKKSVSDTTGISRILRDIYCNEKNENEIFFWSTNLTLRGINSEFVTNISSRLVINFRKELLSYFINRRDHEKVKIQNRISYFIKVLNIFKPDIVHFHDLSDINLELIDYCKNNDINCILTLHIFIGNQDIKGYEKLKKNEEIFFSRYNCGIITTVSNGVKKRILEKYSFYDENDIIVILNATNIRPLVKSVNRIKYKNKKNILCVGKICERKNQIQLIKAYHLLPTNVKKNTVLIFAGDKDKNYFKKFKEEIARGKERNIKYLGKISPNNIGEIYSYADILVSVSKNESFGLTLIEAMHFGVPCLAFYDLDAIEDIYDESAMSLIYGHDVGDISRALELAIDKDWDKKYILEYSQNFSGSNMVEKYACLYSKLGETKKL